MRFVIELDGVLFDLKPGWHRAHVEAATAVGWSKLDQATFWQRMRTKGPQADFLPGAKPLKFKDYLSRFQDLIESDPIVGACPIRERTGEHLRSLHREGPCIGIALGQNLDARRSALECAGVRGLFMEIHGLNADPRRRPTELKALAQGDPRIVVVAASEEVVRSADPAGLFAVGVAQGACTPARLHQAGARLVLPALGDLVEAARAGARRLIAAGLPPESLEQSQSRASAKCGLGPGDELC